MNLYQKLATIADEIGTIEKSGKNEHFKYKFIEHAEVTARIRSAFKQHGLALLMSCTGVERDGKKTIAQFAWTLVNADKPDEKEQGLWYGEADDGQDKGLNKAMTMAEKTLLMKLFHVSDYDPDEDADYKPEAKPKEQKQPTVKSVVAPANTAQPAQEPKIIDASTFPDYIQGLGKKYTDCTNGAAIEAVNKEVAALGLNPNKDGAIRRWLNAKRLEAISHIAEVKEAELADSRR